MCATLFLLVVVVLPLSLQIPKPITTLLSLLPLTFLSVQTLSNFPPHFPLPKHQTTTKEKENKNKEELTKSNISTWASY